MAEWLNSFYAPRSIAFVGASDDPTRIGGRPLHYCLRDGFDGELYAVNPTRATVQGLAAYASVADIPAAEVDLLVIAIQAKAIPKVLKQAAAKNARAAVILTSGFSETGTAGASLEAEIVAIAKQNNIRLLGPNCLGFYSTTNRVAATFSSLLETPPPAGPLAIVSQSGAYGAHIAMLARSRGIGLASFAATGNECDIDIADLIAAATADVKVKIIACYAEGIRDGRALLRAIEVARTAGKSVVLMKVGTSVIGKKAAQSHTASLAGDDRTLDQLILRSGAIRVTTTQELVDTLYVLARHGPIEGDRLGILTVSGGAGILMADVAESSGFNIARMPKTSRDKLDARIPLGSSVNPVDTTAQAMSDASLVNDAVSLMTGEADYDAIVSFFMNWPESPVLGPPLRIAIESGLKGSKKVPFAICMNAEHETVREYERAGLLVFEDPAFAVLALARAVEAAKAIGGSTRSVPDLPKATGDTFVGFDEAQALQALAKHGVPVMPFATAPNAEEAVSVSERFSPPLAIKVLSPDVHHKSDVGGVRLSVEPGRKAGETTADILSNVARLLPHADLRGVLIAPMVSSIAELIIGARIDPSFGPVVSVGMGGVYAELLDDVAIGLAPVGKHDALALIKSLSGFPLLDGARGKIRADLDAAAETISALSQFIARNRDTVAEAEINPLSLLAVGQGAMALDALIVPAESNGVLGSQEAEIWHEPSEPNIART